jgi:hypothetical protein
MARWLTHNPPPMLRRPFLLLMLSLPLAATAQAAVVLEGVRFEPRMQLGGSELVLNGTGVRAVAWFKGYAAALYLPARARQAEQVLAQAGPKRLRMALLQEVPAQEFVKAFEKGIARNTSAAELAALRERMSAFDNQVQRIGRVKRGDVVDLDFEPERGTTLVLNGQPRGEPIPGSDFNHAVLRAFVGSQPYDKALRAGLLGQPA